jgi:shikimate dehydrogenase
MKKYAVIGNPITQSLSPTMHNEIYKQLGIDASYCKKQIAPEALHSFMRSHKFDGLNVTSPHKETIVSFLDELDEPAQAIGAVNCVYGKKGYNTDWLGFFNAVNANGIALKGRSCLILGAGGAARAIAYALIASGVASIAVQNRNEQKGKAFLEWINARLPKNHASNQIDIIVNCTPVGMWPETNEAPEVDIKKNQILIDTIYNPEETAMLKIGKDKRATILGGLDMFIFQGIASTNIWFDNKITKNIKPEQIKKVLKLKLC